MIARLRGELLEVGVNRVVIDAGGVGYEVFVPTSLVPSLPGEGSHADLHVRQVFREDGVSLYGFGSIEERRLFDLLCEVKGCGPKVSLSILAELGDAAAASAILAQDSLMLCRASGVGPRLAERIIVELKDKIQEEQVARRLRSATVPTKRAPVGDDLVDALQQLGYRRSEAEAIASEVPSEMGSLEARLKEALRRLAR